MNAADTMIACATGAAPSARALVRLSGPRTAEVVRACVRDDVGRTVSGPWVRGAFRGRMELTADGGATLPVLILAYAAPRSYTGEDSAELIVPGNPALVERVIDRFIAFGGEQDGGVVRRAGPGEFSARAYLNGRLTLTQAEGVAAVIAAHSEAELEGARRVLSGEFGERARAMSDECATLLALVEAGIDFTDQEDVTAIAPGELARRAAGLREAIAGALGAGTVREVRSAIPRVALVGPPNAGKSTLFNALLGRTRSVAAPVAGTTRDVLAEEIELDAASGAVVVVLEDLPGLDAGADRGSGVAKGGVEEADRAAQAAAAGAVGEADVLVWCHPSGRGPIEAEVPGAGRGRPMVAVRTFGDRPAPAGADADAVPVCALDGWNLAAVKDAIVRAVGSLAGGGGSAGAAAVLPRHRRALLEAFTALGGAESLARADAGRLRSPELIADALRDALDRTGELTGRIDPDQVLGRIFATFCIGK